MAISDTPRVDDKDERNRYFAYGDAGGCNTMGHKAIDEEFLAAARTWKEKDHEDLAQRAAQYLTFRNIRRLEAEGKDKKTENVMTQL
ncbi:hypothetical protein LA080_006548 [Diaporthe eres]|nr:hypothetical protein LA080_006548 [Diaporthe eres]